MVRHLLATLWQQACAPARQRSAPRGKLRIVCFLGHAPHAKQADERGGVHLHRRGEQELHDSVRKIRRRDARWIERSLAAATRGAACGAACGAAACRLGARHALRV